MGGKHGGKGYSNRLSRRKADRAAYKNQKKGGSEEQQKLRLIKRDRAIDEKQRDGERRKENILERIDLIKRKRLLDREEMKLRGLGPLPPPAPVPEEIRAKRRRKDFYDLDTSDWKLRGAAKPAATIGEEAVFNPHERPCGDDNFVKCRGKFCKNYEICGQYLELAYDYAQALRHCNSMKPVKDDGDAAHWFRMCLELGGECRRLEGVPCVCERTLIGLAATLLEKQEFTEARQILLAVPINSKGTAELLWTTALASYAEEGGESVISKDALETASLKNSFIAYILAYAELFDGVLSLDQNDSRLKSSEIALSTAVAYCIKELQTWKSVEGSLEWVLHFVEEQTLKMPVVLASDKSATAHEIEVSLGMVLEQRHQEKCTMD